MYSYFTDDECVPSSVGRYMCVYEADPGKDSLSGSLSVSSMEQVLGSVCLRRRGWEMGDDGSVLCQILRIRELGVSGMS